MALLVVIHAQTLSPKIQERNHLICTNLKEILSLLYPQCDWYENYHEEENIEEEDEFNIMNKIN